MSSIQKPGASYCDVTMTYCSHVVYMCFPITLAVMSVSLGDCEIHVCDAECIEFIYACIKNLQSRESFGK